MGTSRKPQRGVPIGKDSGGKIITLDEEYQNFFEGIADVPFQGANAGDSIVYDGSKWIVQERLSFRAIANSTTTLTTANTWYDIQLNSEIYDYGGNYSTANDEFTAPYDGVYHFGAGVRITGLTDGDHVQAYFSLNGGASVPFDINYYTGTVYQASGPMQRDLNAGDTVGIRCQSSRAGVIATGTSTTFLHGHLIHRV